MTAIPIEAPRIADELPDFSDFSSGCGRSCITGICEVKDGICGSRLGEATLEADVDEEISDGDELLCATDADDEEVDDVCDVDDVGTSVALVNTAETVVSADESWLLGVVAVEGELLGDSGDLDEVVVRR